MKRPTTTRILTLSLLLSTTTTTTTYAADPSSSKRNNTADNNNSHNKEPKKVISLQESIEITQRNLQDPDYRRIREEYWKETFQEIKNLARGYPSSRTAAANKKNGTSGSSSGSSGSVLSQWKDFVEDDAKPTAHHATRDNVGDSSSTISDNSIPTEQRMDEDTDAEALKEARTSSSDSSSRQERPPRFEGFPSWDRLLQDWSEDIQEYLDQASEDSEAGYSFSNFGRAASASTTTTTTIVQKSSSLSETASSLSSSTVVGQQPQEGTTMAAPAPLPDDTTVPLALPELNKKIPIPAPAQPGEAVLPHTDISDKSKHLLIVTTASLPWKTGTAVNPLLRAAYLSQGRTPAGGSVTLLLPWLERREDQVRVYGADGAFGSPEDQEAYVRTWLRESANLNQESVDLKLAWYTAWQNKVENSIYSMGDITAAVSSEEVDICILEEPEHLNWYRAPGESWTKKYKHVVGILHTNYFSYALDQPAALIRAPAMKLLCAWMCRAHCHRVIKLSGTFDKFAPEKELVENVHGVRATFLDVGEHVKGLLQESSSHPIFGADAEPKIYFIGKMLWSKGLGSLMELLKYSEESANLKVSVDMYGGGPDAEAANKKAQKLKLDLPFCGPLDHAELALTHKVFVNPSTSEVLCTTSAEALAMGKFVIIPSHPSNDFFAQFPNCLPYATKEEFVGNLYYALTHEPEVLTDEYAFALSWEAATERLEAAGCIPKDEDAKMKEALASEDASFEISLPPLVDNQESRKSLSNVLRFSRIRYRQFRTKLSQEIQENRALPDPVRNRIVSELDKRLDLDIDEFLDSPKLRFQLSPAELDKSLLELYDSISESPSGDILRVIGGGGKIGLQNFYMRRHVERKRWRKMKEGVVLDDILPSFVDTPATSNHQLNTASQMVRLSLQNNLPQVNGSSINQKNESKTQRDAKTPKMALQPSSMTKYASLTQYEGLRPIKRQSVPKSATARQFSILI